MKDQIEKIKNEAKSFQIKSRQNLEEFRLEFISKKGFGAGARLNQGLIDATNPKYNIGSVSDTKKTFHTGAQLYAIFKF